MLKDEIVEAVGTEPDTHEEFVLPRQLWRWWCGSKGANLERIRNEFRVRVNLKRDRDEVTIEGPLSALEHVKERLQVFARFNISLLFRTYQIFKYLAGRV